MLKHLIVPIFFVFAATLIILEYINGTNFVLNTLKIDYVDVFAVSLGLIILALFMELKKIKSINKTKVFVLNNWKKAIFFLPTILILGSIIVFMRYHPLFMYLEAEDSVVEWLQFLFIFLTSVLNFILFFSYKKKNKLLAIIFLIAGLAFFIVAAEEISWGQRIFNIETPEKYAKLNTQQEITLHNYGPVFGYVYVAYMYMGLIGSTLWLIKPFLVKTVPKILKPIFKLLIPNWYYFLYFFTAFVYNFERVFISPMSPGDQLWEEPMELLLFIGIGLFFFELVVKNKNISLNPNIKKN